MAAQDYSGAAEELTLNSGIDASVTAFTSAETPSASWPTGGSGFFVAVIDPGVSGKEEKVKVTVRSGGDFTVTRGYDDTTGVTHSTGAKIRHSIDAQSFVRANKAVVQLLEKWTTAAQILISTAAETGAGVTVSGDATLASDGTLTLGAGVVEATNVAADVATQAELDAHTTDATAAHAATAISFSPVGTIAGDDVQEAVAEVATDAATALSTHEADTSSVHGITDMTVLANALSTAELYVLRDEKAANTAGGTFTQGAWQTRTLNTEPVNTITGASLATNQFTLPAGTYWIEAKAPAFQVGAHKAKIANITDTTDALIGASAHSTTVAAGGGSATVATVEGLVTIAAEKIFELQHRCQTTHADHGLGFLSNFGVVEVYAQVNIWKVA